MGSFFSSSSESSPFVIQTVASGTTTTGRQERHPRAIVLILGFAGSTPRILAKYANLYNQKGCSTAAGTASNSLIFLKNRDHHMGQLDDFARLAVKEVSGLVRTHETTTGDSSSSDNRTIPVVMHILSNGGAFVARRIGVLLANATNKQTSPSDDIDDNNDDLVLFADRLQRGYQLFDSAPGYPTINSTLAVIQQLAPNPWIGIPLSYLFALRILIPRTFSLLTGTPFQGDLFWRGLIESTRMMCPRTAFVYSVKDDIVDAQYIKDFSESLQENQPPAASHTGWVRTMHLEDSRHVQHLRLHPEQYSDFVETALNDIEESEEKKQH